MPHPREILSSAYHSSVRQGTYTSFGPKTDSEKRYYGVNLCLQPALSCHIGVTHGNPSYQQVGRGTGRADKQEAALVVSSSKHRGRFRLPFIRRDNASRLAGGGAEIRADWRAEPSRHSARAERAEAAASASAQGHTEVTDTLLAGALMLAALAWAATVVLL